jgi:hypothetical protein
VGTWLRKYSRRLGWRRSRSGSGAKRVSGYAAVVVLAVAVVAGLVYAWRPVTPPEARLSTPTAATAPEAMAVAPTARVVGPRELGLQKEIASALEAASWPALAPPISDVLQGDYLLPEVAACESDTLIPDPDFCKWGEPTAPTRIVLVGDTAAQGYAGALRNIALNSDGQIQVYDMALRGCSFSADLIDRPLMMPSCASRKQYAVSYINSTKPQLVVVSNLYEPTQVVGSSVKMSMGDWADSVAQIIGEFVGSTGGVVLMASAPGDIDNEKCLGDVAAKPADCVGSTGGVWDAFAAADRRNARRMKLAWADSRPWFCDSSGSCPAFVGTTVTKKDRSLMAPAYGDKLSPVIDETFHQLGVY